MHLTPDGLESTKRTGGGIRCNDKLQGLERVIWVNAWSRSRTALEISQLGPFPHRLSVQDSIHDSRRALALIGLTLRFLFSSQTICCTPSPTIDVLRLQRQRPNRYCSRCHHATPRRVLPERRSVCPTAHFLSRLRRHVLHQHLTQRNHDHPTRSLFWDLSSSGPNLAPVADLPKRCRVRLVGWLGSSGCERVWGAGEMIECECSSGFETMALNSSVLNF